MEIETPQRKTKTLIPELRFLGFDNTLKVIKLDDVVTFKSGGTPSKENNSYWNGDIPWISASSMKGKYYSESDRTLTEEGLKKGSKLAVKGSLLLLVRGSMLFNKIPIGITERDVAFNQDLKSLVVNNKSNTEYLYQWFSAKQNLILNKVVGTGIGAGKLDTDELKNLILHLPSLPEQQKIASFLSAVDKKIQQLTRKKELLESYKKGVMQQLFTYSKRLHDGEIRTGKLSDFGFFYYGKGAPKTTIVKGAPTPCVRYGELYSTYNEEIKEIRSYTTVNPKDLKLSKGGEVLVPRVGENPLDFANCSYLPFPNVAIGEMISVYNTKEDGLFITYYINSRLKKQLARMVEGGNVSNLYFRYVEKIEIEIPCIIEQRKITNFLSVIDIKIEAVSNQITKTQSFKKGLLQQMFV